MEILKFTNFNCIVINMQQARIKLINDILDWEIFKKCHPFYLFKNLWHGREILPMFRLVQHAYRVTQQEVAI